jgi:hypothetical protein
LTGTIFFQSATFSDNELAAFNAAIKDWSGVLKTSATGIELKNGGILASGLAMPEGSILVTRDSAVQPGHLGEIRATQFKDGYVTAARISLVPSVRKTSLLRRLLAHELGHAFGLGDCPQCSGNSTVMNLFQNVSIGGIGLGGLFSQVVEKPSGCDLAAMNSGYANSKPIASIVGNSIVDSILDDHDDRRGVVVEAALSNDLTTEQVDTTAPEMGEGKRLLEMAATANPEPITGESLRSVVAHEDETLNALKNYTFKRDVLIQTLDKNGKVSGEYRRLSQMVLDDKGNRVERIISFPKPSLKRLYITQEDIEDLSNAQLLGLNLGQLDRYRVSVEGRVQENGKSLLLVRITPVDLARAKAEHIRVFNGVAVVDEDQMRIVRIKGRALPEGNQRFPIFETTRNAIDNIHHFPVSTTADDVLEFPQISIRIRMKVTYSAYRKFSSEVKISDGDFDDQSGQYQLTSLSSF